MSETAAPRNYRDRPLDQHDVPYYSIRQVQEAVASVRVRYCSFVFPEDGTSQDCLSAKMARLTCDNILQELGFTKEQPSTSSTPKYSEEGTNG